MAIFGKKKSKSEEDESSASSSTSYPNYPAYEQSMPPPSDDSSRSSKKKKKGFGSKIKGLVRGKSYKSEDRSARSLDSGPSDEHSYESDYNPHNPPQQSMPPGNSSQLDPRIMVQIEDADNSSSSSGSSSDSDEFHQELKPVQEVNEDEYESDDNDIHTAGNNFLHRIRRKVPQLGPGSDDDQMEMMGVSGRDFLAVGDVDDEEPVTLVILLLDPDSLRFELLQLELEKPSGLKVKDVLGQLEESITEPALQPLKFIALVDRAGGVNKPDAPLTKAMKHRQHPFKDILVGLVKGGNVEELFKRVRPILGDPNVGRMLDMNGFDTAGWAKKKSKESTLEEKTKQEPASTWGRKLKLMTMIAVGLVILMGAVVGLSKHLGSKEVAERAVHIQEAVQEAVQKLVQTETVQEVVASASTSTFANSTIVTNSVQKAVQEVVKKETLQEVVASASTTFTNLTDITEL